MNLYHGFHPSLSKGSLGPGEGAAGYLILSSLRLRSQPLRTWRTSSGSETDLSIQALGLGYGSCAMQAPLCGSAPPAAPQAQLSGRAGQPWSVPCAGLVLGLSAATLSLELLLHPAQLCSSRTCRGSEGSAGLCETRASPGQRWQILAVLPAFLWDSDVHESGNSMSECRSTWWKGNF